MPWNVVVFDAFLAYLPGPKAVNRPLLAGLRAKSGDLETDRSSESARPLPAIAKVVLTVRVPFGRGSYPSDLLGTTNAVISRHLQRDFGRDAQALGFLTSTYFATFAAMQPVLGMAHLLQVVAFVWMIRPRRAAG